MDLATPVPCRLPVFSISSTSSSLWLHLQYFPLRWGAPGQIAQQLSLVLPPADRSPLTSSRSPTLTSPCPQWCPLSDLSGRDLSIRLLARRSSLFHLESSRSFGGATWCCSFSIGFIDWCFWYHLRAVSKVKAHHSCDVALMSHSWGSTRSI